MHVSRRKNSKCHDWQAGCLHDKMGNDVSNDTSFGPVGPPFPAIVVVRLISLAVKLPAKNTILKY